ncbi:hypothetical protein [Amaricoccus macauensis]|uniref:hypothetical protein n=1 Tax=Amaricoccus macauensis TaxID=57001 RepID=UPI003C7B4BEC
MSRYQKTLTATCLVGAVGLMLAACAGAPPQEFGDPATCREAYRQYDKALRNAGPSGRQQLTPGSTVDRTGQRLITSGCITRQHDIAGLDTKAEALQPFEIRNSGAPVRGAAVHAGIVDGFSTQAQVSQFFASLGYRTRSIGAQGVGRRIYIGPFSSEGAMEQAVDVARQAGFVSPYVSDRKY